MKATVVVSTYNQKNYIKECLDSILMQPVDFDYDILVSDDCSTDGTKDIINVYRAKHPQKIKFINRTENVGAAINYLQAHQSAMHDIVFHIDGDDVMLPGKMQKQFDKFKADDKVNIVFHRALYFSDDGHYSSLTGSPVNMVNGLVTFEAHDLALWGSITVHSAYCYRKSSRKHWPEKDFMEWRLAMDSLLPEGRGVYLDEILVKYRCNNFTGAYLSTKAGRARAYNIYFDDLFLYFDKYPALRSALFSNCLVTALAMWRSGCGWYNKVPSFIIKHCYLFRLSQFIKTAKMRKAVAPGTRIR